MLAPLVGYTYAVNPLHNMSDLPANLEWDDLEDGRKKFVQRKGEDWTVCSSSGSTLHVIDADYSLGSFHPARQNPSSSVEPYFGEYS